MKKKCSIKINGITLIALVVTIFILIILVVISINAVQGENSLIGLTYEVEEHQANATASDSDALSKYDQIIANAMAANGGGQ